MGVFSRFRRKAKGTEEASATSEHDAGTLTAGARDHQAKDAAGADPETSAAWNDAPAAGAPDAEGAESDGLATDAAAEGGEDGEPTDVARAEEEVKGAAGPEGVEIPKQQSADEAADSATGEGARQ